jgi:hypothetical protein
LLSEISQAEKDKYCMFSLLCRRESLKMNNRNVKTGSVWRWITAGGGKAKGVKGR